MGQLWNSDKSRKATVILGLVILFVLSMTVVFMSVDEMKKLTQTDCKEELTKEIEEAYESVNEYLDMRMAQTETVSDLLERYYANEPYGDEAGFVDVLKAFMQDSSYLEVLIQKDDGLVYDIEGNRRSDNILNILDNTKGYVTDTFDYPVDGKAESVYAVAAPFEKAGKQCRVILIEIAEHLNDVIRHYDTLKSHIQIYDSESNLITEIYDCEIKEEHVLVEEISVYKSLEISGWKIKAIVDKKVVADIAEKYTSVIFSQMLITITAFILYFLIIVAASVSFTREKKKLLAKRQDLIDKGRLRISAQDEIINAIGKEFCAMYTLKLDNDSYVEIVSKGEIKKIFDADNSVENIFKAMCDDYISPEFRDEFVEFTNMKTLQERLDQKESLSLEYKVDDDVWNKATFVIQKENDDSIEEVLFIITDNDIEKRREAEYRQNLLEAVEEKNRANNSKSNFLSKVSHDIRTPINGIVGMIDIIRKNWEDKDKVAECFEKMNNASKYLLAIVDDVLNMSKFEKGDIKFEEETVNLDEIIDRSIKDILPMANESGITVIKQETSIENVTVITSSQHLQQIFHNILNNAVKYTEKGGAVRLMAEQTGCDGKHASYKFSISDTGIGMSEEFINELYEPFSQEYETARTTYQGMGLGLSIVKGIIDKMGGQIEVKSKEGVGTTFTVILTLPVSLEKENEKQEDEKKEKDLKDTTILVIEDNMLNMEIAVFMLEEAGVNVVTAENGKEGVEIFEGSEVGSIDLILMDVMMPVVDGLEATKMIRNLERPDAQSIPILAMTANAFAEDVLAVKNVGMNDHISKPIVMEKFYEKIKNWI